jgi:hypothetical protein
MTGHISSSLKIYTMGISKGIIVVHKGALGDFLQIWPSLLALSHSFSHLPLYWAGREAYRLWTDPLNFLPCPGQLRLAVDRIYSTSNWPDELQGYRVIWFGLHTPPTETPFSDLDFVPGITAGTYTPPRRVYADRLNKLGVPEKKDWLQTWRAMFARTRTADRLQQVLIFPGAGHRAKCWPLSNFFHLASWLARRGYQPVFVLGPAERERGMEVQNFQLLQPKDFSELQVCLLESDFVIGNDSGPMHLAGLLGRPGLALFGPAEASQWGPLGLTCLQTDLGCSPCTQTGQIKCSAPVCMEHLSLARVTEAVLVNFVQESEK